MDCPSCKYPDTKVIKSLPHGNDGIRRRRECLRCGLRMTTHEAVKEPDKKAKSHVLIS
jgi:transcriptional repressor NrdR